MNWVTFSDRASLPTRINELLRWYHFRYRTHTLLFAPSADQDTRDLLVTQIDLLHGHYCGRCTQLFGCPTSKSIVECHWTEVEIAGQRPTCPDCMSV